MASRGIRFPHHGTVAASLLAVAVAMALVVSLAGSAHAVTGLAGVYTSHYDNLRTGADLQETTLNPSTVNEADFGKIASIPIDGRTYAQPLYVQNLNMGGLGTHDVVFVVTEHDSVYAFDADGGSNTPLWKDSFIDPGNGINPIPPADTGETKDIPYEIGITGTPVIDPSTNTMYLVTATDENGTLVNRLHALDITSGAERPGSPVVINPTVPGTGVDAVNGMIPFNNATENQRAGLAIANGELYVAFANHGFNPPYHGWLLAFNPSSLHQDWVFCTTPNAQSGGIWMGGDGVPIDASGNIYFSTGNGTFDENSSGGDYGDSLVKLNSSGNVSDYFTPYNYAALDSGDTDLASGGVLLLPDQPGAHPHEALAAGKGGTVYVVDRDNMGHVGTSNDNQIVQSLINIFPTGGGFNTGNYSSPVYFNGAVFYGPISGQLMRFSVTNGLLSTSTTSRSSETFSNGRGSAMTISANGANDPNGILWALQTNCSGAECLNGQTNPGVLRAYLASDLSQEIWNSDGAGSRDTLGPWEKFSPPLVANGRVYVAGVSELDIYGLLSNPGPAVTDFAPASGPVGTSVSIDGDNFTGATAVSFHGTSASFTVNSDSLITATVPNGATSGQITVTTPDGSATSTGVFTVGASGGGSLVAAYGFDEGSGSTVGDASGLGNTGTISNATWVTTGKFGDALSFNGSNSTVDIPDAAALRLSSGMTLEAWVNPSVAPTSWRDVIYKANDNYYLEAGSSNADKPVAGAVIGGNHTESAGASQLAAGTWAHLAETYDGANLRLYVNGSLATSTPVTGSILTSTGALQIGGDSLNGQYFNGLIDEVRIYNTALSTAQIQSDMATPINAGSGGGGGGGGTGGGGGGSSGGGGGGGGTADLSVMWTASQPQVAIGGVEDLTATIANKGAAGSTQTHFRFTLPASVQLVGPPYYEYGTGCTGTTAVDCFLDAIGNGVTTKVVFEVRAVSAGTTSVTGSLTDASDANAADNSATVSFQVKAPTPPPPPPSKMTVASVQIVTVDRIRYVVVRVNGSTKTARIHVALLDKKRQTLGSDLTRYVTTNKAVRVGNLRLGKSVATVKVTL